MTDAYDIAIVCTDRGQHPKVRLTTVTLSEEPPQRHMSYALRHFAPPDPKAEPNSAISRDSYTFDCPRCARHPTIKRETWWQAMEDTRAARLDEIDLSQLGF